MAQNKFSIRFDKFLGALQVMLPGFNVKNKNKSILMRIIAMLMFFNNDFLNGFVTTVGKTVYIPEEKLNYIHNDNLLHTLAHEYQHALDCNGFFKKVWFSLAYLFPQILAPFMLLLLPVCWWLAIILFFAFLTPLPAPGRTYYELRGYKTGLFIYNEILKQYGYGLKDRIKELDRVCVVFNEKFTGFAYYKMWPFGVTISLKEAVKEIIEETFVTKDVNYKKLLLSLPK